MNWNKRSIAGYALHNRAQIETCEKCSCYHCLEVFDPSEIQAWADLQSDTAICPYCDIDAVLPMEFSEDKLREFRKYWFNKD